MPKQTAVAARWTDWTDLKQKPDHGGAAAYQMRLLVDGNPFTVPRLLGMDEDALLMVGETGAFRKRFDKFVSVLRLGRGMHSEAILLHVILNYSRLSDSGGNAAIQYRYWRFPTKMAAKQAEDMMLRRYVLRFGEPPPLNCSLPKRADAVAWRECRE